jgi:hypothetical protein
MEYEGEPLQNIKTYIIFHYSVEKLPNRMIALSSYVKRKRMYVGRYRICCV